MLGIITISFLLTLVLTAFVTIIIGLVRRSNNLLLISNETFIVWGIGSCFVIAYGMDGMSAVK